ncbi:MAG TPA: hypothetical protein VNO52_03655 [Methylomirabilota bacterium]|nr:hypothetical protein [Methylomirabilota bacterium]
MIRSWLNPMTRRRPHSLGAALVLLLGGTAARPAHLPVARLQSIFPPGGQAGTTVEVVVTGSDLDDLAGLHFSQRGLSARPKLNESTGFPEVNRFLVAIASNTPPGTYDVRAVGRFGVSNPRAFVVGARPEIARTDGARPATNAFELPLNTVVNARAQGQAVDHFRVALGQGQRLVVECRTADLDSRMDPALMLLAADGRELERARRGGVLDFTAPADMPVIVRVHDLLFRGGDDYTYRLTASTQPRIEGVLPAALLPGERGPIVLLGRNLPGGTTDRGHAVSGKPLERLAGQVQAPAPDDRGRARHPTRQPPALGVDGFWHHPAEMPGGEAVFVSLATAPVLQEHEPNDRPGEAQPLDLPCEVSGRFHPAGDKDWFTFQARKGEVFWVEVVSQRLGCATDPFVLIQRVTREADGTEKVSDVQELYDNDANIGGAEFTTASFDPLFRWEVPEDATYRVLLRDLFSRPRPEGLLTYRLAMRRETPDFRLVALPQPPAPEKKDSRELMVWSPLLRRGETVPVKVLALRRDNFSGAIELGVENLPTGVSVSASRIEPGKNSAFLFLTAADTAPAWTGSLRIIGRAKVGDRELVHEAAGGTLIWDVPNPAEEPVVSRLTDDFALAVCGAESAPISIRPDTDQPHEVVAGGKLSVPLQVRANVELTGPVKLRPAGSPALESAKEFEVDAKATNATLVLDLTQHKLPVGSHTLYLQVETKGRHRRASVEEEKAAQEAARQAEKEAAEFEAAAAKAKDYAQAVNKDETATEETRTKATKAAEEAIQRAREAGARREATAKRAKDLAERAKPREVAIASHSLPIRVRVIDPPPAK